MRSLLLACAVCAFVVPAVAETPAEAAFRAAKDWTVRVQAELPIPFVEDEPGAFEGAGFVVDAKRGWIMTNAHVAGHSPTTLKVAFADGKRIPAERLYVDPHLDVAIITYPPSKLAKVPAEPVLECGALPPVGHPVGAFGHPWGFRFTGTRGIASAVSSRFGADMLQTDAPINAGNSGGPLISLETGRVVGISAAKIAEEEVEGLSFAVPMPYACTVLRLLQAGSDPSPPVGRVDFAIDENDERTLYVAATRLPPGAIDLRVGDEIVAAAGKAVATPTQLADVLRGQLSDFTLTVLRDGKDIALRGSIPPEGWVTERTGLWVDGALFAPAGDFFAGWLGDSQRLMVHHVELSSEAGAIGLMHFDVLLRANGREVRSLEEFERVVVEAKRGEQPLELLLVRVMDEGAKFFEYQRRTLGAAEVGRVGGGTRRN